MFNPPIIMFSLGYQLRDRKEEGFAISSDLYMNSIRYQINFQVINPQIVQC